VANLEKLIVDHAYWSDKRNELKRLGGIEISKCNGSQRKFVKSNIKDIFGIGDHFQGPNCIDHAYASYKEELSGYAEYYGGENMTFEEIWQGNLEGDNGEPWLPCEHCKKVRELKAERVKAGRRLGQIRGTMTKLGRKLATK